VRKALTAVALISILFLFPKTVVPADVSINPVKLFFDARQKTNIIRVKNNADEKLSLQITIYSWAQNEASEDQYSPTGDVILFPKIFNLGGGEDRIIRVGIRVPPGVKEKTYRIYLEEIPQPLKAEGAVLRTVLKIGVPVFISPVKTEASGEIEKIELSKGTLTMIVKNKGNVHFIIENVKMSGVDPSGTSVFQKEEASRYLLEGRSRIFSFKIPKENCTRMNALTIEVKTDKLTLSKRLDVIPEMCPP